MNSDSKNIFNAYITENFANSEHHELPPPPMSKKHDETDMTNPEEKREVVIGKKIIALIEDHLNGDEENMDPTSTFEAIGDLAEELIKMHGQTEDEETPMTTTGPTSPQPPQAEPAPHAAPM